MARIPAKTSFSERALHAVLPVLLAWGVTGASALAAGPAQACGEYEVTASVRVSDREVRLVVAEGTKSQTSLTARGGAAEATLIGFKDRMVKVLVVLSSPMNGTEGVIDSVRSVAPAAPDLLKGAASQRMVQTKKAACRGP